MNTPPKNQNSQIVFSPDTYTGLAKIAAKKKVSVSELVGVICNNYICWSNWTDPEYKDSELSVLVSQINILDQQRKNNLTAQESVNSTVRETLCIHQRSIDKIAAEMIAEFTQARKLLTEHSHEIVKLQVWIKSAIDDINSLSEQLDSSSLPSPLIEAIGRQGLQITCCDDGYKWIYKGIESEEHPSQQQTLASWVKYIIQRHEELLIENETDDCNLFDLLGVQVAEADDEDDYECNVDGGTGHHD